MRNINIMRFHCTTKTRIKTTSIQRPPLNDSVTFSKLHKETTLLWRPLEGSPNTYYIGNTGLFLMSMSSYKKVMVSIGLVDIAAACLGRRVARSHRARGGFTLEFCYFDIV